MSTSPDTTRAGDRAATLLSQWLAGRLDNEGLAHELGRIDTRDLATVQATALAELLTALPRSGNGQRSTMETIVRETLEAIALGADA
jgi:hypothetical protein